MNNREQVSFELAFLEKLKHPNIVEFIGTKTIGQDTYIVMEYMNIGDALSYVRNHPELNQPKLMNIAIQISNGMEYLEEQKVVHG